MKEPKELTLFKTALWGYSTFMVLFLTFFTLLPASSEISGVSDPVAAVTSLLPISLFLVLVLIEHEKYKWNIWRVLLYVYSFLIMVLFSLAIFFVTALETHMGISRESNSSFVGFLYLPMLAYLIIIGYEKFA